MSYPSIHRFIDRVRGISPTSRDFSMSAADAKALHSEITKLLLTLENIRNDANKSNLSNSESNFSDSEWVQIKGGNF